jgi:hypothetical protein
VPPKARSAATADRGMLVLEQKLSILKGGQPTGRRNPALDVLTGRVPDDRLQSLQAVLLTSRTAAAAAAAPPASPTQDTDRPRPTTQGPTAMVLPVAAIRMAAMARSSRPAPSPWLRATDGDPRPRLRLIAPPPSRWSRVPWIGPLLVWLRVEYRPHRSTGHTPRARLAS